MKYTDLLKEHDFSQGIRGKYVRKYAERANVVVLEPDVAEYFPDHVSVNEALRLLIAIMKRQQKKVEQPPAALSSLLATGPEVVEAIRASKNILFGFKSTLMIDIFA